MERYEKMEETMPPDVPPAVKPIMDMAWSENAHPLLVNDPKYGRPGLVTRKIIRILMQRMYQKDKLPYDDLYTLVYGDDDSDEKAQKIGPRVREAKEFLDRYYDDNPHLEYRAVIYGGNENDGTGKSRGYSLRIINNALGEVYTPGIMMDASSAGHRFHWRGRQELDIDVIWRSFRASNPQGLPIEDVNLLCDTDNDYHIPPVLDPYQDELLRRFSATRKSGWHNGRIYRVVDHEPIRDESFAYAHKLNLIGQFAWYRDYIITNRSAAEVVGSQREKVWQLLSSTPYGAWEHTANPLCINLMLVLKPSNKVVINFRSNKNQVNGNQYGPSISETVNANNRADFLLVDADLEEQQFVRNTLQCDCRVHKISTRELLVKAANQELGYPVGQKLSDADIRVVAYARGNREGHSALLAVAHIEMGEYEVISSRTDKTETESLLFIPFDEESIMKFLGDGENRPGEPNPKYRRTPYLEMCLAMALYDEHGPEAIFQI